MLGPVKVLHLPDPAVTATDLFGPERGAELLAEGEAMPIEAVVDIVLGTPAPMA